jgi:3-oxoacyl-(acyl-carrier-protein) synthase
VPNTARNSPIQNAMSSSFAFGGLNAALVLGRA